MHLAAISTTRISRTILLTVRDQVFMTTFGALHARIGKSDTYITNVVKRHL